MIQQTIRTKVLVGILAALGAIGLLLAHRLRVKQQAAAATQRLTDEREKAAQIDRDDKTAIQKIRERNAQRQAAAPKR